MSNFIQGQLVGVFLGCYMAAVFGTSTIPLLGLPWFWAIPITLIFWNLLRFVWTKWLRHLAEKTVVKVLQSTKVKPHAVKLFNFLANTLN